MKTSIRTIAIAAIASIASLCPALHAQTSWPSARINVPFSFDYGTQHFAHGAYTLTVPTSNVLRIRGAGGTGSAMMQSSYSPRTVDPAVVKVVFRKYGDRYFLEQVLSAGNQIDVYESKAERQAARQLAMHGEQGETVALALVPLPSFSR
jgi:hypothetical protein